MQNKKLTPYERTYRYLCKIKRIDDMIQQKQEQIDSLRSLASSTAMHNDSERVQTSGAKDKISECCAKIVDLQAEINADIDAFVDCKADIMHKIDELESLDERNVLYRRYFQFQEFRKISQEMHISERTVYNYHKSAIEHICEVLYPES